MYRSFLDIINSISVIEKYVVSKSANYSHDYDDIRVKDIVSDIDGDDLANEMFYLNICQVIRSQSVDAIVFIGPDLAAHSSLFKIEHKLFFKDTSEFLSSDFVRNLHNEALLLKIAPELPI